MPNPKRRHSKRRTSTRRAHDFLEKPALGECPNCHETKQPHQACPIAATIKVALCKTSRPDAAFCPQLPSKNWRPDKAVRQIR